MKKTIPIFYTIDNSYAPFNAVTIRSVIDNASKDYNYRMIILHEDVSEENMKRIKSMETENVSIEFSPIETSLETITDREENKLRCDYFTLSIYYRIFIADLLPDIDKGVYIDSDIVVPGDISELYNTELGDNIIGAPTDFSIQDIPELINYMENAIGVKKQEYINSAVLVMNLKKMRELKFADHFLTLLNKFHFDCIAPDQDYINGMCNGKITYLDEAWDVMPNKNKPKFENPKLIHYNLYDKPWCYDNIEYEEYFWKYAKETDYYDGLVKYKENYSDEQKASDAKCFKKLIYKADTLPDGDVTFKKKFEAGEDIRI